MAADPSRQISIRIIGRYEGVNTVCPARMYNGLKTRLLILNFLTMKKMELNQMEEIEGGNAKSIGCALSIIGFGLAFAGLVTATGGAGLLIAAAGYSIAPASAALSCLT